MLVYTDIVGLHLSPLLAEPKAHANKCSRVIRDVGKAEKRTELDVF